VGGGPELLADTLFGAATLADVAVDAAAEADLVRSLDVDGERIEGQQLWVVEGEDALYDHDGVWGDGVEAVGARVGFEVVDRALDG